MFLLCVIIFKVIFMYLIFKIILIGKLDLEKLCVRRVLLI